MIRIVLIALFFLQPSDQSDDLKVPEDRLPLEEILPEKSLLKYNKEEKYHNRIKILKKAFEANARVMAHYVGARDIANSYRCLAKLRGLAYHSMQASLEEKNAKELRHKEVKRLEIWLRKAEEDLEDLKLEVPLENRLQFEETNRILEELREQLLRQLFGQALGSRSDEGMGFLPAATMARPAMARGLRDLDKFTDEEFTMIQLAQKVVKRVEAFLIIAENRLVEIERRLEGKEWEEEEPNPLELYTYEDLLHAYTRAIEGIMSNIDDKATSGVEPEEEIRKALKKLDKKIGKFISRLDPLKQVVIDRQDERLGEKLMAAMKASDLAQKGAEYGLKATER